MFIAISEIVIHGIKLTLRDLLYRSYKKIQICLQIVELMPSIFAPEYPALCIEKRDEVTHKFCPFFNYFIVQGISEFKSQSLRIIKRTAKTYMYTKYGKVLELA